MQSNIFKINNREIGENNPAYIVAEIGLNHNGSLDLAKELIKAAKDCGADAVKFQKRNLKSLYKKDIFKDPNIDSQATVYLMDIFKKFELKESDYRKLKKYADQLGITFFCTPFDKDSADFLESIDVPAFKVASADLTNIDLIGHLIKMKKPLILSTGMSTIDEIDDTVALLKTKKAQFSLLHCVSAYPPAFKDVNLRMIESLKQRYGVTIGYSGHERGITVAIAAVALGAKIIEKHFTLDRSMEGPDHNISLMPEGLVKMIDRVRMIEDALGNGIKTQTRGEILSREVFAKSLIAGVEIKKGTIITKKMITVMSPGRGLNPQLIDRLVGTRAKKDFKVNEYFTLSDITD